jgi:hypothetical protein
MWHRVLSDIWRVVGLCWAELKPKGPELAGEDAAGEPLLGARAVEDRETRR